MIKVLHLVTGLNIGGAEIFLSRLVSRMDRNKFLCSVVSVTGAGPVGEMIKSAGIPVDSLEAGTGSAMAGGFVRLVRLLKKERPDVVQTWLYHSDLLGTLAARIAGKSPVIWNLRCSDLRPEDHPRSLFMVIKTLAWMSSMPKAVVVNSAAGKAAHERLGYTPKRWELIPNGFDVEMFRPDGSSRARIRNSLGLGEDSLIVGLVARYDPMKDHDNFLRAAAIVAGKYHNARFILAGKGTDNNAAISEMIRHNGLEGKVFTLGERRDIHEVTAAFDIAVNSSYSEGFPNNIGEAMACGVPCVATRVGDVEELMGDTGMTAPARNPEAMAAAIGKLLEMEASSRREMGAMARKRVEERYSLAAVTTRYEQLYERIAGTDVLR